MRTLRNIFRRKLRAFLTIFGIAIGVLALVVMGAIAEKLTLLVEGYVRGVEESKALNGRTEPADGFLEDGAGIPFGTGGGLRVHHTPGHSPGGVCLQVGRVGSPGRDLFVGDTLFAGSIGRTDLPGGSQALLVLSIRSKLLVLPDGTRVFPGHGPASTIGHEKKFNPYLGG